MVRYPRDYIFSNRFKETGEINLKLIIAWQHHSLTSPRSALWSGLLSGDSGPILSAASWNQESQPQWLAVNSLISVPQADGEGACFRGGQWLTLAWERWQAGVWFLGRRWGLVTSVFGKRAQMGIVRSGSHGSGWGVTVNRGRRDPSSSHRDRGHLYLRSSEASRGPCFPGCPEALSSWESHSL